MADCRVKGQAIDNSRHIKEYNAIVDSGFHALESPLIPEVLDYSQWILELNRSWDSRFLEPKPRIPDSTIKILPDFGFHTNLPDFRNPNFPTLG